MKKIIRRSFNSLLSVEQKMRLGYFVKSHLPDTANSDSMFFYLNNLKRLGYNPDVIVDVGAYQGKWTLEARKIFKESTFLMLEAQRAKEQQLKEIASRYKDIYYRIGLVGKEFKAQVPFFEMETGSSIYEEQTSFAKSIIHYDMHTLDQIVSEQSSKGEFFIKLDVQGAEIDVLEGARETLKRTDFILLEASLLNYNLGAPLVAGLIAYLDNYDFVLFDICEQRRKNDGVLFQVDLIFSRRDSPIRNRVNFGSE